MIVYKLTFANGKSYIGQTMRQIEARLTEHRKASNRLPVGRAWKLYGAPRVEILAVCASLDDLNRVEADLIVSHGTMRPSGYNLCEGGRPCPTRNPEIARRAGLTQRGKIIPADVRAKMSQAAKARSRAPWSAETKAKMAESGKRSWQIATEQAVTSRGQAIRTALKTRFENLTPDQRQAFCETRKRAWETRRANAASQGAV